LKRPQKGLPVVHVCSVRAANGVSAQQSDVGHTTFAVVVRKCPTEKLKKSSVLTYNRD